MRRGRLDGGGGGGPCRLRSNEDIWIWGAGGS
jgi:hypothetical protein